MKQLTRLTIAVATALLLGQATAQAFTFTDLQITNNGTTVPTGYTIAQTNQSVGTSLGSEFKTINAGNGIIQTFTAPTTANGHSELLRFYLATGNSGTTFPTSWTVNIGTISGGTTVSSTQSLTVSTTAIPSGSYAMTRYLEFDLGNANYVQLDDGVSYFFQVKANGGDLQFVRSSGTTAGTGSYGKAATLSGSTLTLSTGALNYYLETTPVPEPSQWALIPVLGTVAFLVFRRMKASASV